LRVPGAAGWLSQVIRQTTKNKIIAHLYSIGVNGYLIIELAKGVVL